MKKILTLLFVMLMSINLTASAATTTGTTPKINLQSIAIPTNIIIKQTITLSDGKTVTIYYQKEDNVCRLYSTADLNKYSVDDLNRIKASSFEIVDHVEGKCYGTRKVGQLLRMIRQLVK